MRPHDTSGGPLDWSGLDTDIFSPVFVLGFCMERQSGQNSALAIDRRCRLSLVESVSNSASTSFEMPTGIRA